MKKPILYIAFLFCTTTGMAQQSEIAAIKQTINNMFDAMRKSDSTLLRSTFAKGMVLHSISKAKNGATEMLTESTDEFVMSVGTPHKGIYDERLTLTNDNIKIDGELASVWAPYKFYIDDKFSHCGVDVFQLMKTAAGWKVIYIVDTRRKDGCPVK